MPNGRVLRAAATAGHRPPVALTRVNAGGLIDIPLRSACWRADRLSR